MKEFIAFLNKITTSRAIFNIEINNRSWMGGSSLDFTERHGPVIPVHLLSSKWERYDIPALYREAYQPEVGTFVINKESTLYNIKWHLLSPIRSYIRDCNFYKKPASTPLYRWFNSLEFKSPTHEENFWEAIVLVSNYVQDHGDTATDKNCKHRKNILGILTLMMDKYGDMKQ